MLHCEVLGKREVPSYARLCWRNSQEGQLCDAPEQQFPIVKTEPVDRNRGKGMSHSLPQLSLCPHPAGGQDQNKGVLTGGFIKASLYNAQEHHLALCEARY